MGQASGRAPKKKRTSSDWAALGGIIAAVAAAVTALAPGIGWLWDITGGGTAKPAESARQFATRGTRYFFSDLGRYYDILHPAEKRLVSRSAWLECERRAGPTATLISIHAVGEGSAPIKRRGIEDDFATVVHFKLRVDTPDGEKTVPTSMALVREGGHWTRIFLNGKYPQKETAGCGE
jgi:hypothetical protein